MHIFVYTALAKNTLITPLQIETLQIEKISNYENMHIQLYIFFILSECGRVVIKQSCTKVTMYNNFLYNLKVMIFSKSLCIQ